MLDKNNLSKLKVTELKKELEDRGFTKTAGLLKADLIFQLKSILDSNEIQESQQPQINITKQQVNNDNETLPPPPPPPPSSSSSELPPPPPPPPSTTIDTIEQQPPPPPPPPSTTTKINENEVSKKMEIEKVKEIFENEKREKEEKEKQDKVKQLLNSNNNNNDEQIIVKPKEDIMVKPKEEIIVSNNEKKRKLTDEEYDNEEFDLATYKLKKNQIKKRKDCPYLDTVDRNILDFDFEKICSVSFHNHNVYACLVCGKYFQGKSQDSHANYHCLQTGHHVFINLKTQAIYCLPDDYEVIDSSLDDIKYLLNPRFTDNQIKELDNNIKLSRALDDSKYLPGIVGLNNIKNTAYVNVIIQSLARIPTIRNYLLKLDNIKDNKSILVQTLSELLRKIWNPKNFKAQVSPHELLQAIQNASQKRFNIRETSDPLDFLQWFLNTLHKDLNGTKQPNSSIIYQTFSGEIQVTTDKPIIKTLDDDSSSSSEDDEANGDGDDNKKSKIKYTTSTTKQPFLFLSLDLPPKPVFKDDQDKSIIPQIPLFNLLSKYDGTTTTTLANGEIKKYKILSLPRYLVLVVKRFSKNNFFTEKEPTIVNFPIKNLDLSDYLPPSPSGKPTKFNLLATIKHEGEPTSGNYSVYINHKGNDKWFEMQDLSIKETMPQLIAVSECYFLIYEKIN